MPFNNATNYKVTQYNTITGDANNLLNNVSPGTATWVLTSNGGSAQPSYQPIPGGSGFMPNSVVQLADDFIATTKTGVILNGVLSWDLSATNNFNVVDATESGHPGIISSQARASGGSLTITLGDASQNIILGGGAITLNWVMKIVTLSDITNRYNLNLGGSGNFRYSDNVNSGNWQIVGGASGTVNTNTAVDTSWHNYQITVDATNTTLHFYIDGVEVAGSPVTSSVAYCAPFVNAQCTSGTIPAGAFILDLMYLTETLTTPR